MKKKILAMYGIIKIYHLKNLDNYTPVKEPFI